MFLNYTLDGTIANSGVARTMLGVHIEFGPTRAQQWETFYSSSTFGTFSVPQAFSFTYGTPFELFFRLYAISGTFAPNSGIISAVGQGTGTADFFNTLVLSGMVVTDQSGTPVPGAQFLSASGTQYSENGVVPEPSTVAMALVPLICLGAAIARRGRSASRA